MRTTVPALLLIVYLLGLIDLTLCRFAQPVPGWNLTPLATIRQCLIEGGPGLLFNVVGNVVGFLPLGILVPILLRGRASIPQVVLCGVILSSGIETAQFLSGRRTADVDDVLLNALGTLLGHLGLIGFRLLAANPGPMRATLGCVGDGRS